MNEEQAALEQQQTPVLRFTEQLLTRPHWRFGSRSTLFIFKEAVVINLDKFGPLFREDFLLIRSIYVPIRERKRGVAREALIDLTKVAEKTSCGLAAIVSPFYLKRKSVFDIAVAMRLVMQNKMELYSEPESTPLIEKMKRLLTSAGFNSGYTLQTLTAFGDADFPSNRQFCYLPFGLDESVKYMVTNSDNNPFGYLYYDDEADEESMVA